MKSKQKQLLTYIALVVMGILIGKWFFASTETNEDTSHEHHTHSTTEVWTCSMHPEIREDRPGDCPICGMDLTLLDESASSLDPKAIKMSEVAMQLAKVHTGFPIASPENTAHLALDGKLRFNEENKQKLTADFHGRIDAFYIDYEGQYIKNGQVIAKLYSPELEALQRELLMAFSLKEEQPKLFEAALKKLRNWNISQADIDEILTQQKVQSSIQIRSPFEGIVSNLNVRKGNHVERGDLLFEVNNHAYLWADFQVYEKDAAKVSLGDSIYFTTRAFPNKQWKAAVSFISPIVEENKRSFLVRTEVNNSDLTLKPSFLVQGKLQSNTQQNEGVWVPKSAVLWTGKRSVVYEQIANENEIGFLMREVSLGATSGDYVEVVEGLTTTTQIAMNGVFSIDAAAQIAAKPSMMNKRETKASSLGVQWSEVSLAPDIFASIITNYLALKEALAEDDEKRALQQAQLLNQTIQELSISANEAKSGLVKLTGDVAKSKNITMARIHFQFLSDAIIALAQQNNPLDDKLYLQFCPMADNDKGAFWLSTEAEIKNPYYGSMMLRCGSVEGEL